jgi:hypothetical protein
MVSLARKGCLVPGRQELFWMQNSRLKEIAFGRQSKNEIFESTVSPVAQGGFTKLSPPAWLIRGVS